MEHLVFALDELLVDLADYRAFADATVPEHQQMGVVEVFTALDRFTNLLP
jgi:hypothetical protein